MIALSVHCMSMCCVKYLVLNSGQWKMFGYIFCGYMLNYGVLCHNYQNCRIIYAYEVFFTPGYSGVHLLSGPQIKEPGYSVYRAVLMSIHDYKTGPFS